MENRCGWVNEDPLYIQYHDKEWGVPVYDDQTLFEFLVLEGAQAGLSWYTVLKKRENYRAALDGFNVDLIAQYPPEKVDELIQNEGLIRNRRKLESVITNAKAFKEIQQEYGSFSKYIWGYVNDKPIVNCWESLSDVPANTSLSDRISKDLKKRGFKFVGTTIIYSYLQATGLVNDHIKSCFCSKCSSEMNIDKHRILSINDPVLGQFIETIGKMELKKRADYFQSLVRSIIGQQLSAKAAATIYDRFTKLLNGEFTPAQVISLSDEVLRNIGISYSKINYIKDLSRKVLNKEVDLENFEVMTNEEVITALTSVKGIGKWTAEMFLIFSLGRENVLSLFDVGLQRGAKWLYQAENGKKLLEEKGRHWEPYHSIASLYLWEAVNRDLVTTYESFDEYAQVVRSTT